MSHILKILTERFKPVEEARKAAGEPFKFMELRCDGPGCDARLRETDEATAIGAIVRKAYCWTIGEIRGSYDYCWVCTQKKNFVHEPQRTADGNPAHGCGICDGEDVCTCHQGRRARCLTCGGKWPDCTQRAAAPFVCGKLVNQPGGRLAVTCNKPPGHEGGC
jgi:hypothetical protein